MNRDALVAAVARSTQWSKKDIKQILLACLAQITETLKRGEDVVLVGFGQFVVGTRRGRRGVNPRNPAQEIRILPTKVVKFHAGKTLKDTVRS